MGSPPANAPIESADASSPERGIASAGVLALTGRAASALFLMLVAVITSRTLGPVGRGEFVIGIVLIGAAGAALNGLSAASVYHISNRKLPVERLAANAGLVAVAVAIIAGPAAALAFALLDGYPRAIAVLLAVSAPALALRGVLAGLFISRREILNHSLTLYGQHVLAFAGMLAFLVVVDLGGAQLALTIWTGSILGGLVLVLPLAARITGAPRRSDFDPIAQRSIAWFATVAGSYGIIEYLGPRVDLLVLAWLRGADEAGIYSAALNLTDPLLFFALAITFATAGDIAGRPRAGAAELTARSVRHAIFITLPFAIAVIIAAGPVTTLLFGSEFSRASEQARILALAALPFAPVAVLRTFFIQHLGRPHYAVMIGLLTVGSVLVLSLALAPPFGMAGVAFARLAASVITLLTAACLFVRHAEIPAAELYRFRRDDLAPYGRMVRRALRFARVTKQGDIR